ADLAGPGGVLTYPLSIRSIDYAYDLNPVAGPLDLDLLRVRGEDGDAAPPANVRWDAFGLSNDARTSVAPTVTALPGGLLRFGVPAT
ncbi:hypothetical protein G3I24_16865, partial [Micromonospora aurantiaca]|nr:hypothetical protein [Micromonospora aurantiaca]